MSSIFNCAVLVTEWLLVSLCVAYGSYGLSFSFFFFSSRRRHTRCSRDWSSDVCSSDLTTSQPILVRYGRVKVAEDIAERLKARLVILLIGERPGGDALASRSLSAYLVYQLLDADAQNKAAAYSNNPNIHFEYTVISNIYSAGLPPLEAGSVVAEKAWHVLARRSNIGNEVSKCQHGAAADTRTCRAALTFIAVTLIASDFHEEGLSGFSIAGGRRRRRLLRRRIGYSDYDETCNCT